MHEERPVNDNRADRDSVGHYVAGEDIAYTLSWDETQIEAPLLIT